MECKSRMKPFVEKPVLLIGTFRNDDILKEIYLAKRNVVSRNLTSSPGNWIKIKKELKSKEKYSGVILNLTEAVLLIATNDSYKQLFIDILNRVKEHAHLIIVYEDTFKKKYNIFNMNYYSKYLFYDLFFTNREQFRTLMNSYNNECDSIYRKIENEFKKEHIESNDEYLSFPEKNSIEDIVSALEKMKNEEETRLFSEYTRAEWMHFKEFLKKRKIEEDTEINKAIKEMNNIVGMIEELELNVQPFRFNSDIIEIVRTFFYEQHTFSLYKKYIYKDQMLSQELEKFLGLFQEYIKRVKKLNIIFEEKKTQFGTIYEFKTVDEKIDKFTFSDLVEEFSGFMDICDTDLENTINFLRNCDLESKEIEEIIFRYRKEAQRLKLDIKQEYERKKLQLKQAIEVAALEEKEKSTTMSLLNAENVNKPSIVFNFDISHLGDEIKNKIYTKTVFGDIRFNEADIQLKELIEKFSDKTEELVDELNILKDLSADESSRQNSMQKLKSFLSRHAQKIGDIGYTLLTEYIKSLLFNGN